MKRTPSAADLRLAFEARGTAVRPPASDDLVTWLEQTFGRANVSSLAILYHTFDGFDHFDVNSFTLIWPLERVRSEWLSSGRQHLGFADVALDALIYAALRSPDDQRVFDVSTNLYVALDAVRLAENMISGRLDF